jgi:hypothetical protein
MNANRALVSLLLLCTPYAISQEVCVELAKVIVFNQSQSFSQDERRSISKADLCVEKYKKDSGSKALQVEVGYKFFSGGASGNEQQISEEQSKQCDNKYGDYWSKSISSNSARTVSADSAAVIGECVRLAGKGLKPSMTMSSDGKEFALALEWNPTSPVDLRLDQVGPRDFRGFNCSAQGADRVFKPIKTNADVKTSIAPSSSFLLACERKAVMKEVDGEKLTCYDETLLMIATGGPVGTIKVPQMCSPTMPGRRAAAMEQRIREGEVALEQLNGKLTSVDAALRAKVSAFSGMLTVATGSMVPANCHGNSLACLAAAHRQCIAQGFEGGFPQEWDAEKHYVLCVGKK